MYLFCRRKYDKNVTFPQIRLAETYSFIKYLLWLGPGLGALKTAETSLYNVECQLYLNKTGENKYHRN